MKILPVVAIMAAALSCCAQGTGALDQSAASANPYTRAIGRRIVGYVLSGSGAGDLTLGIVFDATDLFVNMYDTDGSNLRGLYDGLEKVCWIAGAVELAIGLPMVIAGTVENSRWKKWQAEHDVNISYRHNRITVEF